MSQSCHPNLTNAYYYGKTDGINLLQSLNYMFALSQKNNFLLTIFTIQMLFNDYCLEILLVILILKQLDQI